MVKYGQTIDIDAHNSVSHILRNIKPGSTVLELGSSSGYMTKYMKEELGCKVTIVEIDSEAAGIAAEYADKEFIGPMDGDIERYTWLNYNTCKYDHIIFADVLEHLMDPWQVLKRSVDLLKEDGTILISVPNVGHNSVIIDLINGRFNYRELGLLDNTHIRFFTRSSLRKMVEEAGLHIEKEMNTYCAVEHTEFKNKLEDVPAVIANLLQVRQDGILYQFVWELKR